LRRGIDELFNRGNQIIMREDRPNSKTDLPEDIAGNTDRDGMQAINSLWVSNRIATARSLINAANNCISESFTQLHAELA